MLRQTLLASVTLPFLLGAAIAQDDPAPGTGTATGTGTDEMMPTPGGASGAGSGAGITTDTDAEAGTVMPDGVGTGGDAGLDSDTGTNTGTGVAAGTGLNGTAADAPAVDADTDPVPGEPIVPSDVVVPQQESAELRGDWIMGATVTSTADETIGNIVDLILGSEDGRVTAAVISVGGFLGIGSKQIAVNWAQLNIDHDGQAITLDMTREQADAAEAYVFRDRADPPPAPVAPGTGAGGTGGATTPAVPLD